MRCVPLGLVALLGVTGSLGAQTATPPGQMPPSQPLRLPARLSGDIQSTGELYGASGIQARRPGQSWRMSLSPQLTLFGEFGVGLNILLSSEGSDLRQNISQFGLNPRYKWATLHIGDFTQNYSSYTVQGTRVRGGGLDLRPGILRVSLQGGRSQRTVAAGSAGLTYRRNLYAGSLGLGREGSSFIDVIVVRSKDDVSSLDAALADTTLLDTIPVALRPRIESRPQENLVLGTQGQLSLLQRHFVIKGEVAAALITRDLESPSATASGVAAGGTLNDLVPLTLSTSGDYAMHVDAEATLGLASLRGGYEYVGAGYTSLGLAYLINDRRAWNAGGNLRLLGSRLTLQGQYQHQNDNLLGQKSSTTKRDAIVGSAAVMVGRAFTSTLTAMVNVMANDAAVDTFLVDNHSFALTATSAVQAKLMGRPTSFSVSYALQRTEDANVITRIPRITVHNISTSVQLSLSKAVSVAPTASFAVTQTTAAETQQNVYVGLRGQARAGGVRTSLSATQTFSNSRGVFAVNGQVNYTLPWQGSLTIQGRHNRYASIGNRPAFQETVATMSVARSF